MGWQPIETVPVNTSVLVFMDGAVFEGVLSEFTVHNGFWVFPFADYHGCGCCADTGDCPSHWMPLPEPPSVGD